MTTAQAPRRIEGNPTHVAVEATSNAGAIGSLFPAWTPGFVADRPTVSVAHLVLFGLFVVLAGLGYVSASVSALAFADGQIAVAIGFLGPAAGSAGGLLALFWRASAETALERVGLPLPNKSRRIH